uniref:NME/NM23 nucleoside diphosphate kinase 6 n=1 Tax=Apteryx owenii TaxID=8824 RepID=A0A8B9PCA6_APTOW
MASSLNGRAVRPLQLTLALLKPDAVAHPLVLEAVHETILSNRFLIVRAKELRCGREDSRRFYREHAGRVQRTALVPAGRATSALWAGVLQHKGTCPLCVQG